MEISKELLSEVIGGKVENIIYPSVEKYRMDLTNWCYESAGYFSDDTIKVTIQGNTYDINIYELAHKCKEWLVSKEVDYTLWRTHKHRLYSEKCHLDIEAETEYEAIIKACEWILDNKPL